VNHTETDAIPAGPCHVSDCRALVDLRLVKCTVSALSSSPVLGKAAVHCLRTMYCPWHDTGARGLGMHPMRILANTLCVGAAEARQCSSSIPPLQIRQRAAGAGATLLGTVSHIPALRVRHLEKHLR